MAYLRKTKMVAQEEAQNRILFKNENNGYALISCIVMDKKNPYCILCDWNELL